MVHDGDETANEPLLQPRAVRLLRMRPKLFDIRGRERFLEELEKDMADRRRPHNISKNITRTAQRAAEGPVVEALKGSLERANEQLFEGL